MPTYEYECQKCGHHFELFQSISAEPRKRCPVCRGKVKRLLGTGAGIIFKGSGFYATDYRTESYHKGAAAEKNQSKSSSTKSSESAKSKKKKESSGAKTAKATA